ncbi:hypothetical protein EXIGLDRAFT_744250 [Exidia glandulosa HHB12029]|uniref:Uncharacterized protein n=1 Tax=Exidia glandulosa HHB12029 TaxID=1314781 RepID=A0A165Q4S9_EXIGL|nr:hypothetical protein EXIGLDRAFT_744250 [Exidia glandulosa HHB12029]
MSSSRSASGQTIVDVLFGAALSIRQSADKMRVNTDLALSLSRDVDKFVTAISTELEAGGMQSLPGLDAFQSVLSETRRTLESFHSRTYVTQVMYKTRDGEKIQSLAGRLRGTFDAVMVSVQPAVSVSLTVDDQLHCQGRAL